MAGMGFDLTVLLRTVFDEGNFNLPTLRRTCIDLYDTHYPGFFAPFKSRKDFGLSLLAPIGAPLALGIITALLGAASALSAAICVTSLITTGVCAAVQKNDARDDALSLFVLSGLITIALPLFAVLTSVLTVAALIVPLVSLVTRMGASVVNGIGKAISTCCTRKDDELEDSSSLEVNTIISASLS